MEVFSEAKAEDFLEKEGFPIVERNLSRGIGELRESIKKVGTPFIMKVSGERIFKKRAVRGIKTDIKTYTQAVMEFKDLKKIERSNGVLVQKKISGKEFIAGMKKAPEFGHSIFFGNIKENFVFRIAPFEKEEAEKMIKESAAFLPKKDDDAISLILLKLSELSGKHPEINDAKIRFMIQDDGNPKIIDAEISFDKS